MIHFKIITAIVWLFGCRNWPERKWSKLSLRIRNASAHIKHGTQHDTSRAELKRKTSFADGNTNGTQNVLRRNRQEKERDRAKQHSNSNKTKERSFRFDDFDIIFVVIIVVWFGLKIAMLEATKINGSIHKTNERHWPQLLNHCKKLHSQLHLFLSCLVFVAARVVRIRCIKRQS